MANLTAVLRQLQREPTHLSAQLDRLNGAISGVNGVGSNGRENAFGPQVAQGSPPLSVLNRLRRKGKKVISIASKKRRKL